MGSADPTYSMWPGGVWRVAGMGENMIRVDRQRFTTKCAKSAKKISEIVANDYLRFVRPGSKSTIKFTYTLCFPFALFATFAVKNRLRLSECWESFTTRSAKSAKEVDGFGCVVRCLAERDGADACISCMEWVGSPQKLRNVFRESRNFFGKSADHLK